MSKQNLIQEIACDYGCTKVEAERRINSVVSAIADQLNGGNAVNLPGFGIFKLVHKPARQARHPQTGEPIAVAAKTVVKFSPAAALNASVN